MQRTSNQYRTAMKRPLRERSLIRINVGVINQEASRTAYIASEADMLSYSNTNIFKDTAKDRSYATYEQSFTKLDGKSYFLPANLDLLKEKSCITKNFVTSSAPQEIQIKFNALPLDIKGLTIDFGDHYPVDFTITSDITEVTVTGNSSAKYKTDEVFESATCIKITAVKMMNINKRFRINKIFFGVGLIFDNDKIISSSYTSIANQVNEELPATDYSFIVENGNREFDIESKDSSVNFLETGQNMEVQYGYEIDEGNIEWVEGGTFELSSWRSNDKQAEFYATDMLVYLDDTYYRGQYYANGITLYDLAKLVFGDAGVSEESYTLDTYLKKVKVKNPLPAAMHKECLQMIANAGRCTMAINKSGMVSIKSSFLPDYEATSNGEETYSNVSRVSNADSKKQYACFEYNTTNLVNTYFLPGTKTSAETGYISKYISDESGEFEIKPMLAVVLESAFYTYGLNLIFGELPPMGFTVQTYNDDTAVETIVITDNEESNYILNYEFLEFNKLTITVDKTRQPYNRVKVDYLAFGETTDYTINYDDLRESPTGSQVTRVKEVQVTSTTYSKASSTDEEISTETVAVSKDSASFTFTFDDAHYDFSATCEESYKVYVAEQGAYYCIVKFSTYPTAVTACNLHISGKTFKTSTSKHTQQLNLRGEIKTWENPLIGDTEHAKEVLEWVSDYMAADKEYELSYRGEPALEVNGTFYLENRYNSKLKCRIYQHTIEYNGALCGAIYARKEAD